MWREGKRSGVPIIREQSSVCNLSSSQLDLQRPKSAVCVCVCVYKGLRGSTTEACVDIWFEKSCPPTTTATVLPLAALSTDLCSLVLFSFLRQRVRGRECERALIFVFLCISRS